MSGNQQALVSTRDQSDDSSLIYQPPLSISSSTSKSRRTQERPYKATCGHSPLKQDSGGEDGHVENTKKNESMAAMMVQMQVIG